VAGLLTRRYHGLLTAALAPRTGRTLLVGRSCEGTKDQPLLAGLSPVLESNRAHDIRI
jgi:hypothetical protein